jgi:hypothetical protein
MGGYRDLMIGSVWLDWRAGTCSRGLAYEPPQLTSCGHRESFDSSITQLKSRTLNSFDGCNDDILEQERTTLDLGVSFEQSQRSYLSRYLTRGYRTRVGSSRVLQVPLHQLDNWAEYKQQNEVRDVG